MWWVCEEIESTDGCHVIILQMATEWMRIYFGIGAYGYMQCIRAPDRFPSDWVPTGAENRTPWRALGTWACVFWGLLPTGCHRRYLPGLTINSFGFVGRRLVRRFVPFVFSGIDVPQRITIWTQLWARPDDDM